MADTIGTMIDAIRKLDLEIDTHQEKIRKLKEKQKPLEDKLLKALQKAGVENAAGKIGKARISKNRHPQGKEWPKIYAYIVKKKAWDILQRRLSSRAVLDRLEDGEPIPGITIYEETAVSVTAK